MSTTSIPMPACLPEVEIREISPSEFVVKVPSKRQYFSVGPKEAFLLRTLNGKRSSGRIRRKYEREFDEQLSRQELSDFVSAIRPLGLLEDSAAETTTSAAATASTVQVTEAEDQSTSGKGWLGGQSALFFRISLYDPNELLSWLNKRFAGVWTRAFLLAAVSAMLMALIISVGNGKALLAGYPSLLSWQSALIFGCVLLSATALHELAHGLACKKFGGDVHETGLLFMFFVPCMYCNVSDAWLIPDKRKRLIITAAGGFMDLCLWACAVFVWRVTVPGTLINQIALVVLTVCGGRSFFNFNPLLRLDGYYLLSDWLSLPNLRTRGLAYWMSHLRWMLWGAERPEPVEQGRVLLWYGLACWAFALGLLNLILIRLAQFVTNEFGLVGLVMISLFVVFKFRRVSRGLFESEFSNMMKNRPIHRLLWLGGVTAAVILLFTVPVRSSSSGDFEVRPGSVVQVHVPVTGIVSEILVQDGQRIGVGSAIVRLQSPDLAAQIETAEDLLHEVEASLRRLQAGTRHEEMQAQQKQVARLETWYQLGLEDLQQARIAHEQQLVVQQNRLNEARSALEFVRETLAHSQHLYDEGALAGAQLRQEKLSVVQAESRVAQAEANLKAERAQGTRAKQAEIDRRLQELESARETLALMEAGSRPEDIAAETARLERVQHELQHLYSQRERLTLRATVSGIISAERLREKHGQVVIKDSVFCSIENPDESRVEIAIAEEDAPLIQPGLPVRLKARAIPFESFEAVVESIAPAVRKPEGGASTVVVHCQIDNPDGRLKSGMTGFGRIYRGSKTVGTILTSRAMKYVRTEFWW